MSPTEGVHTPGGPAAVAHGAFRDDIEGLRGIAVGSVVLFHAFPSMLPGGFIGVDVFFVISGFLITRLLLREAQRSGRIDLAAFWARRVRRILPAATLGLCGVAASALCLPALDARLLWRHVVAAALFYYNWRQAGEAVNYLASEDSENVLLHYWSLAVEEQFYLVWPLLVAGFVLWRHRRGLPVVASRPFAVMVGILGFASLVACVLVTRVSEPLGFFATYSRAWQLLGGALVAMATLSGSPMRRPLAEIVAALAIVTLLASFWGISRSFSYPGLVAVVPTAAAALLIASGAGGTWTGRALAVAPLRYVGRISYSWYLWHWPLIAFAGLILGEGALGPWVAIGLSFVLASAAYHFIETPLRFSPRLTASKRLTLAFGAALIALGVGVGLALKQMAQDDLPLGDGRIASRTAVEADRARIYREGCLLRLSDVTQQPCIYGDREASRTLVLLGDSHAANWFPPIDAAARRLGWRLVVRAKAACPPVDGKVLRGGKAYEECAAWMPGALADIERLRPQRIIVASIGRHGDAAGERRVLARLATVAPVTVVRSTPTFPERPTACLRRKQTPDACTWRLSDIAGQGSFPETPESELPQGVHVLDIRDRVCPGGICRAVMNGEVLASDISHLTKGFALTMTDVFEKLLAQPAPSGERRQLPEP